MSTLIFTLPSTPRDAHSAVAFVQIGTGRDTQAVSHGTVATLPRHGANAIALVPAQQLSWHRLQLPKNALHKPLFGKRIDGPHLRAVLSGMLEDQLLDEPQHLHLAMEPGAREGQPVWVCACNKAWLHDALALLDSAGIRPERICPEFVPASLAADVQWNFVSDAQQVWAVHTRADGVTAWPVPAMADSAFLSQRGLDLSDALLVAEPALAGHLETLSGRAVEVQSTPVRWQAAARSDWNLAQFDLAPRSRSSRQIQRVWNGLWQTPQLRPLRWSLLALLLVNLGGLQWSAWQAQAAMQAQQAAIRQVLTQTFPQIQVVVDAPLQMQRQVQALQAQGGAASARDFEAMANALGTVLPSDAVPVTLDFAPGELRATGVTLDPQALAPARAALTPQSYSLELAGDTLVLRARSGP